MSTQPRPQPEPLTSDEVASQQPAAHPDEDGTHDVPDEQVIDKTLPKKPIDDGGRPS